jgi:splicing factor 3A subunit 2
MASIVAQQQAERAVPVKQFIKIGTPGYNIHKLREPESGAYGLRVRGASFLSDKLEGRSAQFEVKVPHVKEGVKPMHRFMSAFEQKVDPPNKDYQYLLVGLACAREPS